MFLQRFSVQKLLSGEGPDNNVIPWKEERKTNKSIDTIDKKKVIIKVK